MFDLSRFSQQAKKFVTKVINATSRKHTEKNSTLTNEKNIHQRFFVCSFEKKLRVKALSNEHSCHNNDEYSASTAQENYDEFNIVNRDFANRSLFEEKKDENKQINARSRKHLKKHFLIINFDMCYFIKI